MNWLKRWRGHKVRSTSLLAFDPSHSDLYNACLSYRHDFGLLSFDEQTRVRDEALYWLRAWGHTLPQFKANTPLCVTGAASDMPRQEGRP